MTTAQIKKMILEIVEHLDYDIYKDLMPQTAEDPDSARETLDDLALIAQKHLLAASTPGEPKPKRKQR